MDNEIISFNLARIERGREKLCKCDPLLFVNLSAPDVFFFMQVKRRYRTKQSDIFFSRLFYPVPSCIISYVTIK